MSTITITNNQLYKGTGDKSAITFKDTPVIGTVTYNEIHGGNDNSYGIRTEGAFSGSLSIKGNLIEGFGSTGNNIQLDATTATTAVIEGNILIGGQYQIALNKGWTLQINQNTFYNPVTASLYSNDTAGTGATSLNVQNNAFIGSTKWVLSSNHEVARTYSNNSYYGGGSNTNWSLEGTAVTADPLIPIYSNPSWTSFILPNTSPLVGAGACPNLSRLDFKGRRFNCPSDIGAVRSKITGPIIEDTRITKAVVSPNKAGAAQIRTPAAH